MSGMDRVLQDVLARPYALKDVSIDTLRQIWAGVGSTLNATLQNSKGMSIPNFGTWSFHVDAVDLGTQKKSLRTPVFTLSERFARQYNLKNPKKPSGISGQIPVRDMNVLAIAAASGQPRDRVAAALKDIFLYVGEQALAGAPVKLDFQNVGTFLSAGGSYRFTFAPRFAGTFEVIDRPGTSYGVIPPTPSVFARMRPRSSTYTHKPPTPVLQERPASRSARPPTAEASRPGSARVMSSPGLGGGLQSTRDLTVHMQEGGGGGGADGRPRTSQSALAAQDGPDEAQVYVLKEPLLDVSKVEIVVRDKELVVRQADIGFERVYPLHPRADAERITARYRRGALEIRVPDRATSLRACYEVQIMEREKMKRVEEGEDQDLLEMNSRKNLVSAELERQAIAQRRRARAEIEAFNRTQATIPKEDLFSKPLECGYLLYNRKEAEGSALPAGQLRKILDAQVSVKQGIADREKEYDRVAMQGEAEMLKREIAEDERKGWVDKRTSQRTRMEQLDAQMREKVARVDGTFSAICNFPRKDKDVMSQQQDRDTLRQNRVEQSSANQARGQRIIEERRSEYKQDMDDLTDVMQALEEEQNDVFNNKMKQKALNKKTWQAQMAVKKSAVNAEVRGPPPPFEFPESSQNPET